MGGRLIRNAYEAVGATAAVLLSWAVALWLEGAAGLHTDAVVLAVVLTLTLARSPRTAGRRDRLLALALLPAAAAGCAGLGRLLAAHYGPGAALFTAVLALAVWIRRYGRAATTAGTLITLPLVALLVVPGPTLPTAARHEQIGWAWSALIGVLAWTSVQLVRPLADRVAPRPAGPGVPAPRRPTRSRPRPSTRMAVQLAVAVAAAFALGRLFHPGHWTWPVLSAYLVTSGNRGRSDVLRKGVRRLAGACAGTLLATAVAAAGITGNPAVAAMFAVLAVALWLRPLDHAFWAAGTTTALTLLLGRFGQDATGLLPVRLSGIALGAALAVAAAWWLLPVRGPGAPGPNSGGGGAPRPAPPNTARLTLNQRFSYTVCSLC
ncbi:FUSC family protein, partial [Streptomyces misionensis]|uniref:FUSC family protein n=1 Tax=Streptomyces misionensis TaxID=67331 RepID=UPI0036A7DF80